MPNTQKSINEICKYRGIPKIKKGQKCNVNGEYGKVCGGNHSANFNVKFDSDNRVRNCHPYHKMKIYDESGEKIIYER